MYREWDWFSLPWLSSIYHTCAHATSRNRLGCYCAWFWSVIWQHKEYFLDKPVFLGRRESQCFSAWGVRYATFGHWISPSFLYADDHFEDSRNYSHRQETSQWRYAVGALQLFRHNRWEQDRSRVGADVRWCWETRNQRLLSPERLQDQPPRGKTTLFADFVNPTNSKVRTVQSIVLYVTCYFISLQVWYICVEQGVPDYVHGYFSPNI